MMKDLINKRKTPVPARYHKPEYIPPVIHTHCFMILCINNADILCSVTTWVGTASDLVYEEGCETMYQEIGLMSQ